MRVELYLFLGYLRYYNNLEKLLPGVLIGTDLPILTQHLEL